jgi:hypothetical protein
MHALHQTALKVDFFVSKNGICRSSRPQNSRHRLSQSAIDSNNNNKEGKLYDWKYYKNELQKVPSSDFPFDSYEVLAEKQDQILVKQLNSESPKEEWVKRIIPSRKK